VALTVCKNNPHDQHVFNNTLWPFVTRLPTPGISLSSPILVQRHVNAMVLSKFLRLQDSSGKLDKLTLDWWMLPRDGQNRQERFVAWCENFDKSKHPDLHAGLLSLIQRTVFEGRTESKSLIDQVGKHAIQHAEQWLQELTAIEDQLAQLSKRGTEDQIPRRALEIQKKRLTAEYLLRELAGSGFLPGYGFPTDITSFETLNKDSAEITRNRDKVGEGREDNRFQRRELPSRDTVTALREYAPGASVVIDGLVYESAGITLNWHAPATQDQTNELQNIRRAWRCRRCGASGTHVQAAKITHCQDCGSDLSEKAALFSYLEPAGFSVDLYAETHNDITLQKYIPVEPPWIAGRGEWLPLANPDLGRFRSSTDGSVFHYSSGLGQFGYAVCLECGRAAPMASSGDASETPDVFKKPHKRLRGRRGEGEDWRCGGSDQVFKIKKDIRFGREYNTDVLELALYDAEGHPLVDATTAYTLAVALRRVVAASLGVTETELGCDSKEIRDEQDRRIRVLQLFDVRSAGYSSLVAPQVIELLQKARQVLLCEHDCDTACQNCLLTFDTRFRIDSLDRKKALEFLTPQWLQALALPEEDQVFGTETKAEYASLDEALTRELNRSAAKRLLVYLHGAVEDWDFPSSPLRALLHRLSVKSGIRLALVVGQADLTGLSRENVVVLQSLQAVCNVELQLGTAPQTQHHGFCMASVEIEGGACVSWGSLVPESAQPAQHWGLTAPRPLVIAKTANPVLMSGVVALPFDNATVSGVQSIEVTQQLDGAGGGFGARFWSLIDASGSLSEVFGTQAIRSITYEDRYLATPVSCALLVELLSALKVMCDDGEGWSNPPIYVLSSLIDESRPSRARDYWGSDWPSSRVRDDALRSALIDYCGMQADVVSKAKHQLIHGRRLTIDFADAQSLVVWLDQGLSYWSVSRGESRYSAPGFPMHEMPQQLGERLANIPINIEGHALPTHLFVDFKMK
jgi:ribosomal protein L37E